MWLETSGGFFSFPRDVHVCNYCFPITSFKRLKKLIRQKGAELWLKRRKALETWSKKRFGVFGSKSESLAKELLALLVLRRCVRSWILVFLSSQIKLKFNKKQKLYILKKLGYAFDINGKPSMNKILWKCFVIFNPKVQEILDFEFFLKLEIKWNFGIQIGFQI